MSQHDFNIANQGFPATRADINNAFQAIASNSSGPTAPSTTYANMWWYDTTNNKMYLRNGADSAWIEVAVIDQSNNEWKIITGEVQAKDGDGLVLKTDDGTTRLFINDSGQIHATTALTSGANADMAYGFVNSSGSIYSMGFAAAGARSNNTGYLAGLAIVNGDNATNGDANDGTIVANIGGEVVTSDSNASDDSGADLTFWTKPEGSSIAERMRIDDAGNIGFGGITQPQAGFGCTGCLDTNGAIFIRGQINSHQTDAAVLQYGGNITELRSYGATSGSGIIRFMTGGGGGSADTERMRIAADGDFLHGKTTDGDLVSGSMITYETSEAGGRFTATANGSTGGAVFLANNTIGNVCLIRCDGDLENINNAYSGFSDERIKENIEDAGSQWDDVKALRVRKYSLIQDGLNAPNKLGVIAQELEASGMSGLVSTNNDLSNPDETIKTVKYSILYMKAVKALQEAMTRIEQLETRVAALESS
jgi:hypothetical protein